MNKPTPDVPSLKVTVWLLSALLAGSVLTLPTSSLAGSRIAAVIGSGGVVTTADAEQRLKLMSLSAGKPFSPEAMKQLTPQAVYLLIDEEIYKLEADRLGLQLPADLRLAAIRKLEEENHMPPGGLREALTRRGVPFEALEKQLDAQLLWTELLKKVVQPRVSVSEREVEEETDNIVSQRGYYEVKLSEIMLPFTQGKDEDAVMGAAKQIIKQLDDGANFAALARDFSRGPSAPQGGELAWTGVDKLPPELRAVVDNMQIGQVTNPVKAGGSLYIMRLDDKRAMLLNDDDETEIGLRRIFVPVPAEDAQRAAEIAKMFGAARAEYSGGCSGFPELAKQLGSAAPPDMAMVQVKTLDKGLAPVLAGMPVGELSPVTKEKEGMNLFMICERTKARPTPAAREKVKQLIYQKKLQLEGKRYLQELRSKFYVDLRI